MSPSQLYCITKQLQLPHPSGSKFYCFSSAIFKWNLKISLILKTNSLTFQTFAMYILLLLSRFNEIFFYFIFLIENSVDLGYLYEFLSELKRLSITDFISQISNGEQHEISFTFDLSIFTKIEELQVWTWLQSGPILI